MRKPRYQAYSVGKYRLGWVDDQFCVAWWEEVEGEKRPRRKRHRLYTHIEVEARIRLDKWARDRERVLAKEAKTVGELFDAYIADRKLDKKPLEKHQFSWKALAPVFGHLSPTDIDKRLCHQYRDDRYAKGRKVGTVWTEFSVLRAALGWAAKSRLIATAPFIWSPEQPEPRDVRLTRDEAEMLIAGAYMPHTRLFIILALTTAARTEALLELTWDRCDFDTGVVDLNNPDRPRTNKGRARVPMNTMLRAALMTAYPERQTGYVIEWKAQRVSCIQNGFKKAVERSGITKHVTPHVMRHTAASWMAEAGVSMSEIAQYLGHRDSRTTERIYARFSPNHLKTAASALELKLIRKVV